MEFKQAVREAARDSLELNFRDRVRLNAFLVFNPKGVAALEHEVAQHAINEHGLMVAQADGRFDWAGFADFIKAVLPLILEIIEAIS